MRLLSDEMIIFYLGLISGIEEAEHGWRGALIRQFALNLNVSRSKVYKNLKELGYETNRKGRIGKIKKPDVIDRLHDILLTDAVIEQLRAKINSRCGYDDITKDEIRHLLLRMVYDNKRINIENDNKRRLASRKNDNR